jgi:hypothetical protein
MDQNTYSPLDSSAWPNRFNKADLQWDDLKRIGRIIIPVIIFLFLTIIYPILYSPTWIDTSHIDNNLEKNIFIIKLAIAILSPVISAGISISILFSQSEKMVRDFHQIPDDYHHRLAPLIKRKLFGVPPFPVPLKTVFKYPFITLQKTEDLEEDHWARWFGGPATMVIYDGVALYLERGNQFSRVLGPGLPMPVLERHERIKAIVDLRPQVRETKVKTWTKDGIEVKLKLRVEVQVASSKEAKKRSVVLEEDQDAAHLVYPYDACEVKKLVERTAVKQKAEDKSLFESDWQSAALGSITGKIKAYIAGQSINELVLKDDYSPQFLSFHISDELSNTIRKGLEITGSQLISLQIKDFAPVDGAIFKKLTDFWHAHKETLKAIREGESKAKSIRATQSAQTAAQQDLLSTIIENLDKVSGDFDGIAPDRFSEASILLLAQTLDQGISDPIIGTYLAREVLETFEILRKQLGI